MTPQQMPLPFVAAEPPPPAGRAFLHTAANAATLALLDAPSRWPEHRLAVWGEAGCGKSHLLRNWAGECGARIVPAVGLHWPHVLQHGAPLAIDDADTAAEEPLLHVMNVTSDLGWPLLLASRAPPAQWATKLPDLASRLRAMAAVELRATEDALLAALFARLLAERQLTISAAQQTWLLARLPRTPAALQAAAERLDQALLASGGRVTRALAMNVLEPGS